MTINLLANQVNNVFRVQTTKMH